jgi:hypothetical protein
MLPLYSARIEDLGPGTSSSVDCATCRHVALLTPEVLLRMGLSPAARVLDLKGRLRCRGCGRRGASGCFNLGSRSIRRHRNTDSSGAASACTRRRGYKPIARAGERQSSWCAGHPGGPIGWRSLGLRSYLSFQARPLHTIYPVPRPAKVLLQ